MLEDQNANYIEVYDREGHQLVSHKTLIEENGYPIDFSISEDGTKMVVSYLAIKNGALINKLMFYNFSNSGKNVADRMMGEFTQYEETIVPTVEFVTNNDAIAIGENVLTTYKMKNSPQLREEVKFTDEIQKVFCNEDYVGIVLKNNNSTKPYRVEVYNLSGNRKMKADIDKEYENFTFSGDSVLMYNDMDCRIISLKGITKLEYTFKGAINSIIPIDGTRTFLFMTNSEIQRVKLK